MSYTIFCFTGTGNSLYLAKRLEMNLGNANIISMANHANIKDVGGSHNPIGFVFPSYFGNLPRIVKNYIERLSILPDTWIFGIVTMGAMGEGSISALQKALKGKGNILSYACGVKMPANYIMKYNPARIEKGDILNKKADIAAQKIAKDIQTQKNAIRKNFITANNLYKNINQLDKNFYTDNNCIHCGVCKEVCPVNNIDLIDGTPQWKGNCEHCTACINWCPKKSIQYGNKTGKRRQYHNPDIQVSELIKFK